MIKTQHCPNCEATEQKLHDFKQEVSDAVKHCHACSDPEVWRRIKFELDCFIIPKPKPDPLVEVLREIDHAAMWVDECAREIRASLDARGFEIREKNDD